MEKIREKIEHHPRLRSQPERGGEVERTHESFCGVDVRYFIRDVQVLTMYTGKFAIKVDNPWLENNLWRKNQG